MSNINNFKVSSNCGLIIHREEGLERKRPDGMVESYKCPRGIWTIGYGNTYIGRVSVTEGMVKTVAECEQIWLDSMFEYENAVNGNIESKLIQDQFDSLTSLCYNCGPQGFRNSAVCRIVNHNPADIAIFDAMVTWVNSDLNHDGTIESNEDLPGLVIRRYLELLLYFRKFLTEQQIFSYWESALRRRKQGPVELKPIIEKYPITIKFI